MLFLRGRRGEVRDFVAFDNAKARRLCAGGAKGENGALRGGVREQVPIGRVHGLPDSIEIGLAVRGPGAAIASLGERAAGKRDNGGNQYQGYR